MTKNISNASFMEKISNVTKFNGTELQRHLVRFHVNILQSSLERVNDQTFNKCPISSRK